MLNINRYTESLNLYKRVAYERMTLQTLLGNVLLSGAAGATAVEVTYWYSHNQAISATAGVLAMAQCVRKLETSPAGDHTVDAETQPDLALVADTLEVEPDYSQAA